MNDLEILTTGNGWVVMYFNDGSAQSIHTSLNEEVLAKYGATPRKNAFFDLERLRYIPFRETATEVEVFETKPQFDSEVLNFASRFI